MLGVTITNHLSAGEHVRDVIGKCAQSLHALKLYCAATAWATTRWSTWFTSTRPSYSPSCCLLHPHGKVLPARPTTSWSI